MTLADPRPLIYLAGPDVFFPDRAAIFQRLAAACEQHGLRPLPPWDDEAKDDASRRAEPPGPALARQIYDDNIRRIRSADGVIAHLRPFRGHEPDSGTVFELGFALALGKPVVGYGVPPGSVADRVRAAIDCVTNEEGQLVERASGVAVEDFGLALNLMLACPVPLEATADAALGRMAQLLRR
ncbi:MAG: nucleoside 2-deoxyribosyltransferase [Burkholderiaceae bacterium]|nr:nucleoside 2-deoxyribosyltransferase [Burkholderiaceae bacterium]